MRIVCCIPKATNIHSEYVINIDFPQQQQLNESSSVFRCTYSVLLLSIPLQILSNIKYMTSLAIFFTYLMQGRFVIRLVLLQIRSRIHCIAFLYTADLFAFFQMQQHDNQSPILTNQIILHYLLSYSDLLSDNSSLFVIILRFMSRYFTTHY